MVLKALAVLLAFARASDGIVPPPNGVIRIPGSEVLGQIGFIMAPDPWQTARLRTLVQVGLGCDAAEFPAQIPQPASFIAVATRGGCR